MAGKLKLIFGDFFKSLHQLWLEVSGTLFLVFGATFGFYAVKEYRNMSVESTVWRYGLAGVLSLVTIGFGIHSFWKARKLR